MNPVEVIAIFFTGDFVPARADSFQNQGVAALAIGCPSIRNVEEFLFHMFGFRFFRSVFPVQLSPPGAVQRSRFGALSCRTEVTVDTVNPSRYDLLSCFCDLSAIWCSDGLPRRRCGANRKAVLVLRPVKSSPTRAATRCGESWPRAPPASKFPSCPAPCSDGCAPL